MRDWTAWATTVYSSCKIRCVLVHIPQHCSRARNNISVQEAVQICVQGDLCWAFCVFPASLTWLQPEKNPGSEQKNKCLSLKIKVYPLKTVWTVLFFLNKGTLVSRSHLQGFQPAIHNNTLGEHCQMWHLGNVWVKNYETLKTCGWNSVKKGCCSFKGGRLEPQILFAELRQLF